MIYQELSTDEFRRLLAKSELTEDRHGVIEEFVQKHNKQPANDEEVIQYLIRRYYNGSRTHLLAIMAAEETDTVIPELLGEKE